MCCAFVSLKPFINSCQTDVILLSESQTHLYSSTLWNESIHTGWFRRI